MKLIRPFVSGLAACGLVLGMVTSASALEQGMAKVVGIKGSARYMTSDNQTWRPLKTGTVLRPGAVIQTAADSHVDLVLNNPNASSSSSAGLSALSSAASTAPTTTSSSFAPKTEQDAVRIYPSTVLGIDKLMVSQTGAEKVTETQLDLKAGRILGTVKKLSPTSQYEVKIPNGVAGIRGTVYTLTADGVLTVLSGSVVLSYVGADGTPITQEIRAGQQYDAKTRQVRELTSSELAPYWSAVNQLQQPEVGNAPTTFTVDRTVYFVSPDSGR